MRMDHESACPGLDTGVCRVTQGCPGTARAGGHGSTGRQPGSTVGDSVMENGPGLLRYGACLARTGNWNSIRG